MESLSQFARVTALAPSACTWYVRTEYDALGVGPWIIATYVACKVIVTSSP